MIKSILLRMNTVKFELVGEYQDETLCYKFCGNKVAYLEYTTNVNLTIENVDNKEDISITTISEETIISFSILYFSTDYILINLLQNSIIVFDVNTLTFITIQIEYKHFNAVIFDNCIYYWPLLGFKDLYKCNLNGSNNEKLPTTMEIDSYVISLFNHLVLRQISDCGHIMDLNGNKIVTINSNMKNMKIFGDNRIIYRREGQYYLRSFDDPTEYFLDVDIEGYGELTSKYKNSTGEDYRDNMEVHDVDEDRWGITLWLLVGDKFYRYYLPTSSSQKNSKK